MSTTLAAAAPSAYWYLARGTGVVSLLLLTASVLLGLCGPLRVSAAPRWPRFAVDTLHRDVSLLVLAVLVVHVATSVLDSFAPIRLTDAVIPFAGVYRPLWLGLGALSFDLLIALVLTSLVRRRLGYARWRAVHWLAYASWPVAVLHGLGTGTDTKIWWMLALTAGCVAAVLVTVLIRIARARGDTGAVRVPAVTLALATTVGIGVFTLAGPLAHGWAARAGTPGTLLATGARPVAAVTARGRSPASAGRSAALKLPFAARLSGTIKQTSQAGGSLVDLSLRLTGGARGRLRVRLAGAPLGGGGLSMTGSQVDLLADGLPAVMQGQIVSLQGQQFLAQVAGPAGSRVELRANLIIDGNSNRVTGTLAGSQSGGTP
jgi:hypothetical protein